MKSALPYTFPEVSTETSLGPKKVALSLFPLANFVWLYIPAKVLTVPLLISMDLISSFSIGFYIIIL